jgi:hypothetical protein
VSHLRLKIAPATGQSYVVNELDWNNFYPQYKIFISDSSPIRDTMITSRDQVPIVRVPDLRILRWTGAGNPTGSMRAYRAQVKFHINRAQ